MIRSNSSVFLILDILCKNKQVFQNKKNCISVTLHKYDKQTFFKDFYLIFLKCLDVAEKSVPADVLFLQNRIVEIEGVIIVGVEASPYMLYEVEIDEPVDIILSHGAPKGVSGNGNGCEKLLNLISAIKPKISLFGHIHSPAQRIVTHNGIQFINISQ